MISRLAGQTGILLTLGAVALLLPGCSGSRQLESVEGQLSEIQRQLLQLQRQSSSKEEVAELGERLVQESERELRSEADLQLELRQLAERIEELEDLLGDSMYRIGQLSDQLRSTNRDLEALVSAPSLPGEEGATQADPETLYEEAYAAYRDGSFDHAVAGFRRYVETYPDTERADNALYWMGESHFSQETFKEAIAAFSEVLARYPRSEKVPSALLKRAFAYLETGERERGIEELHSLLRNHPSSEEASIARQQLEQLEATSS